MTFSMFLDGYTVAQPASGYDLAITGPTGRTHHLYPAYDSDYAYDHEATMARAIRFIALMQYRHRVTAETRVVTVMPKLLPIRDTWQDFLDANADDDNGPILADLRRQGWHIGGGGAAQWFAVIVDDGRAVERMKDAEGEQRAKITADNCDDAEACAPILDRADLIEAVVNTMLAA